MTIGTKLLAGVAAAALLLPAAASAHDTNGLNLGQFLGKAVSHEGLKLGIGANASTTLGHRDNDNDGDRHEGEHATSTKAFHGNASTTAARLTAKANRLSAVADFFASFSGKLSQKIASSSLSASSTAAANLKLADYNTNVAGAQLNASAAATTAAQINAGNATSTNAGFVATAKADLKAARDFLNAAKQDFRAILQLIFKS